MSPELVVKAVGESGGYGMLMGPSSDKKTIETFEKLIADPPPAWPVIPLSRCPATYDSAIGGMSPGTWICGLIASTTATK